MEILNTNTNVLQKLCRICLNECNSTTSMYHKENIYQTSVMDVLRDFSSLKVDENPSLPNLICTFCENEAIQICAFKLKFEQSDKYLKSYLNSLENENSKEQIIVIVKDEVDDNSIVPCYAEVLSNLNLDLDENAVEFVEIKEEHTELQDVQKNMTNTRLFKCRKCKEMFDTKLKLMEHRRKLAHYVKKAVVCSVCKMTIPTQNYKSHFLKHSAKFSCEYCNKNFSNNFNLKRHLFTHTHQTPFECHSCKAKFSRQDKLKTHMMIHTGEKPFVCDLCGLRFRTREKVNLHQLKQCNSNDDSSDLEKYKRTHSCDICFKKFTLLSSLYTHKLLHTDKHVICNVCGKPYPNEKKLNQHQLKVHTSKPRDKDFLCNMCGRQYGSKLALERHLLGHFGLDKTYKCNICGKGFTQSGSLNLHLNIHSGEKPYLCHICSMAFIRPSNLQRHIRVHENIRPFSCNICEKTFSVKSSLIVHLRIHSGEKPYICDVCGKKFIDRGSLTKHLKTHNNI